MGQQYSERGQELYLNRTEMGLEQDKIRIKWDRLIAVSQQESIT